MLIKFSLEFFLKKKNIDKILKLIKNKILIKPKFITFTYNSFKINKDIINYFILLENLKAHPHIICINKIFNYNYLLNMYYLNNLNSALIIKGDNGEINNYYYVYNFLNIIKKNYKNNFKIYLGSYPETNPSCLKNWFELKNNLIKNLIIKNRFVFITQYFYNSDSYFYFFEELNKLRNKTNLIPGILFSNCFKKIIFFSNICRSELPVWILKMFINNFFKIINIKLNIEIISNLILKLMKFKFKNFHFYTINNLNFSNHINENLKNLLNL